MENSRKNSKQANIYYVLKLLSSSLRLVISFFLITLQKDNLLKNTDLEKQNPNI